MQANAFWRQTRVSLVSNRRPSLLAVPVDNRFERRPTVNELRFIFEQQASKEAQAKSRRKRHKAIAVENRGSRASISTETEGLKKLVESDDELPRKAKESEKRVNSYPLLPPVGDDEDQADGSPQNQALLEEEQPEPAPLETYLAALQAGEELRAINLSGQGVTDQDLQHLVDKLPSTCRLSALWLDANDIEAEGAKAIAQLLDAGAPLLTLSLKWNMIGEQGIIYLAEALKQNKTLAVLSLEANYIGEYGAEALAESLKVNTSLTDVNLKENDLCDDGVRAIAEALAVNRSINCLDLSNNSIGSRGTTFLAETLRSNTNLHYLILTGNLLYDEGAEALAEALRDNQSLQALELANNAIREVGVMAVASILSHNTALSDLDVSLNEAGLRGEITLYDAMMGQPGREIVWKAPGAECIWTSEEVQQIIEHYGVTRILKGLIIDDQGLDPLIPDEKLISHLTFPTVALANSFFTDIFFATDDRDFTKHISMKVRAISVLIGMLKSFQITTTEEANLPLEKQNPLIQAVCNHFEELASMLSCPKELQGKKVMLPAGPVSPPVSSFRLKLLDLFKVLVNTHCACIDARIVRYRIIKTCLNLFFCYQWNPFLQQGVIDFIIAVLETNRDVLTNETTTGCQLFTRIVEAFKQESGKPQTKRAGYMAHLTQLANLLNDVTQRNPALNRAAKGDKAWQAFLASELATANKNNGTWDSMFPRPPPGQRPSFPTKPIDPSSEFGVS